MNLNIVDIGNVFKANISNFVVKPHYCPNLDSSGSKTFKLGKDYFLSQDLFEHQSSEKTRDVIKCLTNEEEFESLLDELFEYKKALRGSVGEVWAKGYYSLFELDEGLRYDTTPKKYLGVNPYCGYHDISSDINKYLKYHNKSGYMTSFADSDLPIGFQSKFDSKFLTDVDSLTIRKFISCLDYSLRQIDKDFGEYSGWVFRGGVFSPKYKQYWSTSKNPSSKMIIRAQRNQEDDQVAFHMIKTKHGHNISEYQKLYNNGNVDFIDESEVLLQRGKNYTEITDDTTYQKEKLEFAKQLNKYLYNKYTLDEIIAKIHVWKELD